MIIYPRDAILTAWTPHLTAVATTLAPTFIMNAEETEATATFGLDSRFAQTIVESTSRSRGQTLFAVVDLPDFKRYRGYIDTTIIEKVDGLKRLRIIIPEYEHTRALHAAFATRDLPDVGADA